MEYIFLKLFNMSITASWLVLAVVVLRLLLKKAPKYIRCILWGLVGVRLVCPFSFESMLSLIPSAETVPAEMLLSEAPAIHSGIDVLNQAVNPAISQSLAPALGASVHPMQVITYAASVIWMIGVVLMVIYTIVSYARLRRRVGTAVRLHDNIWQSERVSSPFVLGMLRPRIYLPFGMPIDHMTYVLAHENAHIKRRDHWIKPIGFALLTLYWFNPLMWVAYILLCRDIELACDEKVIKQLGLADKRAYSKALLSCAVPHAIIAACPLAFGEVGVKQRVKGVLHYKKPAFWMIVIAVIACIVVSVCFLTNPVAIAVPHQEAMGRIYSVDRIDYDAPQYSWTYTKGAMPSVALTEDGQLAWMEHGMDWAMLGTMTDVTLTKSNFDDSFARNGDGGWREGNLAGDLRQNNNKAWELQVPRDDEEDSQSYYVLQQKNGDVYLARGQHHADSESASIRWLFKLSTTGEPWDAALVMPSMLPEFPLYFDLEYTQIEAQCSKGELIARGGGGDAQGSAITMGQGTTLYWKPGPGDAPSSVIYFTVYNNEDVVHSGEVSVTSASDVQSYTATLLSEDGLVLSKEPDDVGVRIYAADPSQQGTIATADVDGDGADETLVVTPYEEGMLLMLSALGQDGTQIWSEEFATAHVGWNSLFLCEMDGKDYLLRYNPTMFQGAGSYHYELFTLDKNGSENVKQSRSLDFVVNGMKMFDVGEMNSFAQEINQLLSHSTLLLSTEQGDMAMGPASAQPYMETYGQVTSSFGVDTLEEAAISYGAQIYVNGLRDDGMIASYEPVVSAMDASAIENTPYNTDGPIYEVVFTDSEYGTMTVYVDQDGVVLGASDWK